MADSLPGGRPSAKFGGLESTESSKESFSVSPAPKSYRGGYKSVTNPNRVGVASPDTGHTGSK
ncbi:hypothetical protein UFOVP1244_65 [uncultured Caudovirales phage]|uniref:Uncharacterized protein n=1 Tax=uncultured Caudovirales phage TaxID=2100421 RepID=A0A6J5RAA1_9CAUD|nr:hypothetical protein UFOVP1244_65 [uncultured Caudovirales phage]